MTEEELIRVHSDYAVPEHVPSGIVKAALVKWTVDDDTGPYAQIGQTQLVDLLVGGKWTTGLALTNLNNETSVMSADAIVEYSL